MKKSHRFNELSGITCISKGCNNKLKQRIVESPKERKYCYRCWKQMEFNRRSIGTMR